MGREGTGVEARGQSIRVNFTFDGVWRRAKVAMPPTPANMKAAAKLVVQVKKAINNGTFTWADYFPDSLEAKVVADAKSFGQWCDLWFKSKGQLASKTKNQYRNSLGIWKGLLGDDTAMAKLTHTKVAAVVGGEPWKSAKLLNNYLITLRGVFAFAGRDLKTDNPMVGIENSKAQKPPPDPLSVDEMEKVLASLRKHMDERAFFYFEFAFLTGMRPEELIALRWGDVDWGESMIRVERARTDGQFGPIKTYQVRDVDLVARAVAALDGMKKWSYLINVEDQDDPMERCIFQSPVTGKPWHDERSQRETYWQPTLRQCRIKARRAYQTRHTYATNALRGGVNPSYVSRQMGHANPKMLFTVYAKWIDGADRGREKAKMEVMLAARINLP